MNSGSVPAKTERGRLEIAARSGSLTSVQRRVLILVDGKRTVNELGAFVRVGELEGTLEHLLAQGLVVAEVGQVQLPPPAAQGFASPLETQAVRPATSPEEFIRVREEASRFVRDKLGAAAAPICGAIDRCSSPHELRKVFRGIEVFVGERLDAQTTQAFVRHFGAMLM